MSLNGAELKKIAEDLALEGGFLRGFRQSDFEHLLIEFYSPKASFELLISVKPGFLRLCRATGKRRPSLPKPPRFPEYLRSHYKGCRVAEVLPLGEERIIRLTLLTGGESRFLYIRLWGQAANVILTSIDHVIEEAWFRRPKRGEIPGGVYHPEMALMEEIEGNIGKREIRDFPGEGPLDVRVDLFYSRKERDESLESGKRVLLARMDKEENALIRRRMNLVKQLEKDRSEVYKVQGDLLLAHLHQLKGGEEFFNAPGYDGVDVRISLDPKLSPKENAEAYFKRYKKEKRRRALALEELESAEAALGGFFRDKERVLSGEADAEELGFLSNEAKRVEKATARPGLSFISGGHEIFVGRTAKENEALLKRFVRGNDYWLHARDFPGGYVFIRTQKGKSVPLEVLIDAGMLAIWYSKGKSSGAGDVYYTQVKFLKRVKGAKAGLVIPQKEKNLHIKVDEGRIEALKMH